MEEETLSDRHATWTLLVVSLLLLTLELAQIRLFSYSLFQTVVYVAIAITLLGLGASGTILAMSQRLRDADPRRLVVWGILGFAVAVPLSHLAFAQLIEPRKVVALGEYPLLAALLVGLTIPHFLLGLIIARLLSGPPRQVHRRYFGNLLGSSLGCLAFIPLLPRLGLERLIMVVALGGALVGLTLARGPRQRRLALGLVILCLVATTQAPRLLDFPARYGQLEALVTALDELNAAVHAGKVGGGEAESETEPRLPRLEARREYSVWNPVGRIEIHSLGDNRVFLPTPVDSRFYSQDGSNGSILIAFPADSTIGAPFFEGTVYGSAYFGDPPDSVLTIGLGGGPDIFTALHYGARSVTGVEINQAAIDAIEGPMADFLGDPYRRPGVHIVCADGRAFLRQTSGTFDVIQLTGVDTGTALAPGSNVLAENYLYTREAIRDLLAALNPDGVLSILRFGVDPLRLSLIACEVLRERGSGEPGRHLVVIGQGFWQNLLIKRTPFTTEELARLDEHVRRGAALPRVRVPIYELLGFGLEQPLTYTYHPASPGSSYMSEFWTLVGEGRESQIFERMPEVLRSVTDDRPFFFFNFFGELRPLLLFLAEISGVAALFILAPLIPLGRRRRAGAPRADPPATGLLATLLYFIALGAGYLVVEIVLMQRLVLFLGHPSYSISVTLFALLLFSSLGAMVSGRAISRAGLGDVPDPAAGVALVKRTARRALVAVAVLVLLLALDLHQPLLRALEGLPLAGRALVAFLLVAPLGFVMGVPFPAGLHLLGRRQPELVPWAIGVNGFASVVAAVGNIPLAMVWGFRAVLLLGGGLYLLALVATSVGALTPRASAVTRSSPDRPRSPA
jgi:SAM-dependent methyltransferase